MQDLQERIRRSLELSQSSIMRKAASDAVEVESADKDPKGQKIDSPEEGRTGAADDLITNSNGAPGVNTPGTHSEVTEAVGSVGDGGLSGSIVAGNKDGEAEAVLDPKQGEVTKDDVELVNKAASAVLERGAAIFSIFEEEYDLMMNKFASAQDDVQTMLYKRASAGDVDAQVLCDMIASFEYGMAKKAADLEELAQYTGAETPEDVEVLENALNDAAAEDPEAALSDEDAEDYEGGESYDDSLTDEELAELEEAISADTENAAQDAILDVAEDILDENPEIDEETAILLAQDQVADALAAVEAEQMVGDIDEETGDYSMNDEDAGEVLDNMAKSASAYPYRGILVDHFNAQFGLSSEQFETRVGLR